jgi:hypothetical protein
MGVTIVVYGDKYLSTRAHIVDKLKLGHDSSGLRI